MTDKPDDNVAHLRPVAAGATGDALERAEGDAGPEHESEPAALPAPAPAAPEPATNLPSLHQDHAHAAITLVSIKRDELQAQYNQVKAELEGSNQAHEAAMAEKRLQFETEQNRASEAHADQQDKMKKLLANLDIALTTFDAAITTYNDLMKPLIENIKADGSDQAK